MRTKFPSIPVHSFPDENKSGIFIGKISAKDIPLDKASHSHRHDFHFFMIQEKGTTTFEIDFKRYNLKKAAVLYIHPNQVHRFLQTKGAVLSGLLINNENLNPEYLPLLEEISPAKPLLLDAEKLSLLAHTATVCLKFLNRKKDNLYHASLKDICNALVALILSEYEEMSKPAGKFSRAEVVSKAFRQLLERNFFTEKSPAAYAKQLNISVPYLNECVKKTTGHPVSYHIQQRVVLEAKRLLYYSHKSVKEIAAELGYEDYPYFSRLFAKVSRMTAITFRNKNHG
ncbi:MAG: AraC family transcriptional regulator [Chitinophagaceae bacterium]